MAETLEQQTNGKVSDTKPGSGVDIAEIGSTGLKRFGGIIFEEFLRELQTTDKRYRIEREMSENDASISAMLFAIEMLSRQTQVIVTAGDETENGEKGREFLEGNMNDMSHTWDDFRSDVLRGMLVHGFHLNEEVYKKRLGPDHEDKNCRSKFNDGLIGWKKLPIRSQDTIWDGWIYDENGDLEAIKQQAYFEEHRTETVIIPYEKILHFRTTAHKGNPEGRSCLRGAFRSWIFKKRIENILATGIERDLAGLPIMWVPPEWTDPKASAEDKAALAKAKRIVERTKRDEQEGMVLPMLLDENGNKLVDFQLLTTGGKRQFDVVGVIKMYENMILRTTLSSFIKLGEDKVGSYSLSENMTAIFANAIDTWLNHFDTVINHFAIPRLFALNPSLGVDNLPKISHGPIEKKDLDKTIENLVKMTQAGAAVFPNDKLTNFLLAEQDLPVSHDSTP